MNHAGLRFRFWRCLWVQGHAFDPAVGDLSERERQELFALAVEEQKHLTTEAERLGFAGEATWLDEYSLAALERTPQAQLRALEVDLPDDPQGAP